MGESQKHRYCWRIYFKVLRVLFSWGSFPSLFAFQEGMWDTQISAVEGSPTVSAPLCTHNLTTSLRNFYATFMTSRTPSVILPSVERGHAVIIGPVVLPRTRP
jgi:hypothetical protein